MSKDLKKHKIPCAQKISKKLTKHGDTRIDNYFWMRLSDEQKNSKKKDIQTKKVIKYLKDENKYYKNSTLHTEKFKNKLFEEIKSKIKKDDQSVPYKKNGYYYKNKFQKDNQYKIYLRKKASSKSKWKIIFDENKEAKKHKFFHLHSFQISEDNNLFAYSEDVLGRRMYIIKIKNLKNNKLYKDKIENTSGDFLWAKDNKTIFYIKKDKKTLRPCFLYKHIIGTKSSEDKLIFEEKDEAFTINISKTKNKKYIILSSYSTKTTEQRVLKSENPEGEFKIIQKRIKGLEYYVDHSDNSFYILSNDSESKNFKISKTSEDKTEKTNWKDFIKHRKKTFLENFLVFKDYMVLQEKEKGLSKFRIIFLDKKNDFYIQFKEEVYSIGIFENNFKSSKFIYTYESMTTPESVIEFDINKKTKKILKEQKVLGDFKKQNYRSKRVWVKSRDGKKIAVSMVFHKSTKINKNTPLLLYGYGYYGITIDPYFSISRLSLLDRGFIFVIAHVRGGQYLGKPWYEDGRMLNKKNTFNDFINCSLFLIKNKYTSEKNLYAQGGSAGGLLMGAVMNEKPKLYNGIIAKVPFVDVVSTMLDKTIPLTVGEYSEWGSPNEKKYYNYIKSYSPYDQIKKQNYPNIFVSTGFYDSQVQYWEPAKWVAKLREFKTDNNLLFLKTDMNSGHGGASGRFNFLKEISEIYTFLLMLENKID